MEIPKRLLALYIKSNRHIDYVYNKKWDLLLGVISGLIATLIFGMFFHSSDGLFSGLKKLLDIKFIIPLSCLALIGMLSIRSKAFGNAAEISYKTLLAFLGGLWGTVLGSKIIIWFKWNIVDSYSDIILTAIIVVAVWFFSSPAVYNAVLRPRGKINEYIFYALMVVLMLTCIRIGYSFFTA